MAFDPTKHHRRSIRLKDYDYSQEGAYFVTLCAQGHRCLFGTIADGTMDANAAGLAIAEAWEGLPGRFQTIELDAWTLMPNHFHGTIVILGEPGGMEGAAVRDAKRAGTSPAPTLGGAPLVGAQNTGPTIGQIVGAFKSLTTIEYIRGVRQHGWPGFDKHLWQRNYHEHIVRDEPSLNRIREYIATNPERWEFDRENPERRAEDAFDGWLRSQGERPIRTADPGDG